MTCVQVTVYLRIIVFLFNRLEKEQARKFGIVEINADFTYESAETPADWYDWYEAREEDWYKARKEWEDLIDNIIERHGELETLIYDMQPMVEGCSDVCNGEGNCKPRGENMGIWEV